MARLIFFAPACRAVCAAAVALAVAGSADVAGASAEATTSGSWPASKRCASTARARRRVRRCSASWPRPRRSPDGMAAVATPTTRCGRRRRVALASYRVYRRPADRSAGPRDSRDAGQALPVQLAGGGGAHPAAQARLVGGAGEGPRHRRGPRAAHSPTGRVRGRGARRHAGADTGDRGDAARRARRRPRLADGAIDRGRRAASRRCAACAAR